MGTSRKEKKAAKKALKRIKKEKQKRALLEREPDRSYNRKIVSTEMPWPLEVILMGRKDVIIFLIIVISLMLALAGYGIWTLIQYIMEFM